MLHFLSRASKVLISLLVYPQSPRFHSARLPTPWIDRCPQFAFGDCCRDSGTSGILENSVMATTDQSPKQLERKAAAKEEIVNASSGAREIVDHAAFNARAVGKILLHPFNKEAKTEAIATAREDKAVSGQKMGAIREIGAQQADALRSSVRGVESAEPVQPGTLRDADAKPAMEGAGAAPVLGDRARD